MEWSGLSAHKTVDTRRDLPGDREEDLEWHQAVEDRKYEGPLKDEDIDDGEDGHY